MDSYKEIPTQFNVRTDLAIEAREMVKGTDADDEIPGVNVTTESFNDDSITVSWVEILDEEGQAALGKPKGNYITIEAPLMKENDVSTHEEIVKILAEKLISLKQLPQDSTILIVGLGNWNITPDALGPKVVSRILVTRHLFDSLPEEIDESVRAVSAVSPGVMGITGIETGEIIHGIVAKIKPDLVIAIDALAARRTNRINTTIQMSDTGVCPGAGVGNKRKALNQETLGVPVIAIGVPTVVDAATLVNDTMDKMLDEMIAQTEAGSEFYSMLKGLDTDDKYRLIIEILTPYSGNMFVTPKDVDAVVDRLAFIIANGINIALHPGIDFNDINRFTH